MTTAYELSNEELSELRRDVEDDLAGFELPRSREDFIIETDESGSTDTVTVRWFRDNAQPDVTDIPMSRIYSKVEITYEVGSISLLDYNIDRIIRESSESIIDLHVDHQEVTDRVRRLIDESANQDDDSTYSDFDEGPSGWTTDFGANGETK